MKLTQLANDHVSIKIKDRRKNDKEREKNEDGNCSYMVYV